MSVADFMTKKLITVRPETRINDAVDLMKNNDIHRLPVLDNGQLVGLVTEGIIQAALPSKATSLSVYEVNYLLNKTTVADVMEKDVRTIPADAVLEDAIYQMRHYKIGVLPVIDNGQLVGIITNNDIFDAFLNIAGYDKGGTTVTIKVTHNVAGFLAKVSDALAEHNYNILTLMVTDRADVRLIELHVDTTDATGVKSALTGAGFELI
ncbi:CBS and ACT domain-containing protein [Loigolactobacillus coryniformis]|uniref:CBS and ACT domain-containing protein n=1 Tax=Loigolactobacillus coryniformis TaxID=1610 RepID=UPI00201B0047|nr:CBS and ACT domain-containing protein [Loigolactobacillus coryniformis]MCL5459062.1 CBS and ACT domain-containing protein [Loigolactobacillus coryniformis]